MHTHVYRYAHHTRQHTHTVYSSTQTHTPHLCSDPGQTQTHGSTLHTHALPPHTHTPVAVDLHFTHRHTHSNLQFCTQLSQEIETYMHRGTQPSVCSCMKKQTAQTSREDVHTHTRRRTHGQVKTAGDFISSCIFRLSPQGALPGRQLAEKAASGPCGHREPRCHY